MVKYIIGNMTGNSMDAIDLILTKFNNDQMTDICTYTKPYSRYMQQKIETLRVQVQNKTKSEIERIEDFKSIHDEYVRQIANAINEMCTLNHIDKKQIDAIGFHGKTLDHNPPSKALKENTIPYTLQIGSGKMLADLTNIPVVYDFRSDYIKAGFEGAPLIPPHNAHIAATLGDGCYYNGGNTSNFALITQGTACFGSDAGPCNEYTDGYIRQLTTNAFDKDGKIGLKGKLNQDLLQTIFNIGQAFYETPLPRSGDPAYYHKNQVFDYTIRQQIAFEDTVHTFEYFAAYIAVHTLSLIPENIDIPSNFFLFGGGWKNPVVYQAFENLLNGKGYILPKHKTQIAKLQHRFPDKPKILLTQMADFTEARLMADLARYKLENKVWELPEVISTGDKIISGIIAQPNSQRLIYDDYINRAAKK